ncbi:MAG TPA: hypothetical protein VFZ65_18740 [Planctomycetota bacterium]|nr:hypothetical protein [Planctomycetota bacterium]
MKSSCAFVWLLAGAPAAPAPEAPLPGSWVWEPVPDAGTVALAVLWRRGYDDDRPGECGAARVLAECRLERARAEVQGTVASGLRVGADASVVFVLTAAADWPRGAAFVAALLDDTRPLDDDLLARTAARAALAADDGEFLYPGLVLQGRARLALCTGAAARPAVGSATAIQQLAAARVRALLREPVPRRGWGIGALPEALRERCEAAMTGAVAGVSQLRIEAAAPVPGPEFVLHARVDAPFVAAGFLVPADVELPCLAVGVEVARRRAERRFRMVGREAMARAPLVNWSWLDGDPLVVFCRRGFDPVRLWPGEQAAADAEAERAAVQRDLQGLLEDLRKVPPSAKEIAAARDSLQVELAATAPDIGLVDAASERALLPGRVQARLLAAHRGIDGPALQAVTADRVHDTLRALLRPERTWWGGLMPYPVPSVGWASR